MASIILMWYLIIGVIAAVVYGVYLEATDRSLSFSDFGDTVALSLVILLFWLPILLVMWVIKPTVERIFK